MPGRYVVVGDPIAHSLSPQIHQMFASQVGIELIYDKQRVTEAEFESFFARFWSTDGLGANVTVPLKGLAFEHAQFLDPAARRARAVNTLARKEDGLWGYNTDGLGLCRDLIDRHGVAIRGSTILLLGAGGAARGVVQPLLDHGCDRVVVANRTPSRAVLLAADFADPRVSGCGYTDLNQHLTRADLVINATSFALGGGDGTEGADVPLAEQWVAGAVCYDMSYGGNARFCAWAAARGASASLDGLGVLVEQAAAAFTIWHDAAPSTQPVVERLQAQLAEA